jgi:hypothetical protein
MPELPEKRIQEAISKALADVRGETERQEARATPTVGDDVAWKISYDTHAASVERATPTVGDDVAWKISYDTHAASVE